MTGKVLRFPGSEVPSNALPPSEPPVPEVVPPDEPIGFLDWVYLEVVDFQSKANELVEVAEQGEDAFWDSVRELTEQLLGWAALKP